MKNRLEKPVDEIFIWWKRLEQEEQFLLQGKLAKSDGNEIIFRFDGTPNAFLSNFYVKEIIVDGLSYQTSEHFYQAKKPPEGTIAPDGQLWSEKIRLAKSPYETKKLGRVCPLRPDWEPDVKFEVMREILRIKFQDPELAKWLLATGKAYLIEGNVWHDNTFGICIKKDCERGCGKVKGRNMLGKLLMERRAILEGKLQ